MELSINIDRCLVVAKAAYHWLAFILAISLIVIIDMSCKATSYSTHAAYQALIVDCSELEKLEEQMRTVAGNWNLGIYESDRNRGVALAKLSKRDGCGVGVSLYYDKSSKMSILSVNNFDPDELHLSTIDTGEMPINDLERLTQDMLRNLEAIGLEFSQSYPR